MTMKNYQHASYSIVMELRLEAPLKTYARLFEEKCCICNFSLKRKRLTRSKNYPFELENTAKKGFFFSMESISERVFQNIYSTLRKPTHGKLEMDLFSRRIRFSF